MTLTDKDIEIYNFIKDYCLKNNFTPSIREIGKGTGLSSTNSVYFHMMKLEKYGLLIFKDGRKQYRLAGLRYVLEEVT